MVVVRSNRGDEDLCLFHECHQLLLVEAVCFDQTVACDKANFLGLDHRLAEADFHINDIRLSLLGGSHLMVLVLRPVEHSASPPELSNRHF